VYRWPFPLDGSRPGLLTGYGAYGACYEAGFQSHFLSLLDRGFVVAIAHVRGGEDLGRRWYEDGKLLRKRNSFTDFIAAAEHLIAEGYTSADRLAINGASAGCSWARRPTCVPSSSGWWWPRYRFWTWSTRCSIHRSRSP